MKVEITRTTALFPTAVFVQWDATPEPGDSVTDFYVTLERSGSADGPWELVAETLKDTYHYLDSKFNLPPPGLNLFSLNRVLYYRVTLTDDANTVLVVSDPTPVEPGLDTRTRLLKRKILHDESTGFRRLNGVPFAVLKRRHWGQRCTRCYDPATKESTEEHCPLCFGATYLGGYWAPVYVRGRREPTPVQTQMSPHGVTERQAASMIILDYPAVEYHDLIVDLRRNDRWLVEVVSPTELKGVVVHQKLLGSNLSRNSVEFTLKVDPKATPPLY